MHLSHLSYSLYFFRDIHLLLTYIHLSMSWRKRKWSHDERSHEIDSDVLRLSKHKNSETWSTFLLSSLLAVILHKKIYFQGQKSSDISLIKLKNISLQQYLPRAQPMIKYLIACPLPEVHPMTFQNITIIMRVIATSIISVQSMVWC